MTMEERDRRDEDDHSEDPQNFGEVLGSQRRVVILGDPGKGGLLRSSMLMVSGSGKTTACRWLACCLARSMQTHNKPRINDVPFGPPRLPILLRVSAFADTFGPESRPSLLDYLGSSTWLGSRPTMPDGEPIPREMLQALFTRYIKDERAVVILDGLDELTDHTKRSHGESFAFCCTANMPQ